MPWATSSGKNMGSCTITNSTQSVIFTGSTRVYPTSISLTISNLYLSPSTVYFLNFEFFNVGI
jgi:hypothetical protein